MLPPQKIGPKGRFLSTFFAPQGRFLAFWTLLVERIKPEINYVVALGHAKKVRGPRQFVSEKVKKSALRGIFVGFLGFVDVSARRNFLKARCACLLVICSLSAPKKLPFFLRFPADELFFIFNTSPPQARNFFWGVVFIKNL